MKVLIRWLLGLRWSKPAPQLSQLERLLFTVGEDLGADETQEVKDAINGGILLATRETLESAKRVVLFGWPLLIGVLIVSFSHLASQIVRVNPANVAQLEQGFFSPEWYFGVSLAFTLLIDAIALYLVAVGHILAYIGRKPSGSKGFYILATGLLNGGFVLRNAPGVAGVMHESIIYLDFAIAVMLTLMVPISIVAVERGRRDADHVRLTLLAKEAKYTALVPLAANDPVKVLKDALKALQGKYDAAVASHQEAQGWYDTELRSTAEFRNRLCSALEVGSDADLIEAARATLRDLRRVEATVEAEVERRLAQERRLLPAEGVQPIVVPQNVTALPVRDFACEGCGAAMSSTEKGVAGRVKTKHGGKYLCGDCRAKV